MSEIPAHSGTLLVAFRSPAIAPSEVVAEPNVVVHVVANALDPLPAIVDMAECGPSKIRQLLRVAM